MLACFSAIIKISRWFLVKPRQWVNSGREMDTACGGTHVCWQSIVTFYFLTPAFHLTVRYVKITIRCERLVTNSAQILKPVRWCDPFPPQNPRYPTVKNPRRASVVEHTPPTFPLSVHTHISHPPTHPYTQTKTIFVHPAVLRVFWDGLKLLVKIRDIYWGDRPPIARGLQLSPTSSDASFPVLAGARSTAFFVRKAAKNSSDSRWLLEWESFISSQIRNRPPSYKLTVPAASVSARETLS